MSPDRGELVDTYYVLCAGHVWHEKYGGPARRIPHSLTIRRKRDTVKFIYFSSCEEITTNEWGIVTRPMSYSRLACSANLRERNSRELSFLSIAEFLLASITLVWPLRMDGPVIVLRNDAVSSDTPSRLHLTAPRNPSSIFAEVLLN